MGHLSPTDLQRFSEAVLLLHDEADGATVYERFVQAVGFVVPEAQVYVNIADPTLGCFTVVSNRDPKELEPFLPAFNELVLREHPFMGVAPERREALHAVSDFVPLTDWERTALVNEVFRPSGTPLHQAALLFRDHRIPDAVSIHQEREFASNERLLFQLLRPHLERAWRRMDATRRSRPARRRLSQTDFLQLRRRGLTRRECEVLFWLAEAKTDGEIALLLGLSLRTINHHVSSILRKLGVENRVAAATFARDLLLD